MLNYWRVYGYSLYNITQFFWFGDLWPSLSPTQQFCRLRGSTCLPIWRQISSTLAPWHPKCCWPVGLLVHTHESTKLRMTPFSTWLICATMLLYQYCLLIWSLTMSPRIYVCRFNVQLCPWWFGYETNRPKCGWHLHLALIGISNSLPRCKAGPMWAPIYNNSKTWCLNKRLKSVAFYMLYIYMLSHAISCTANLHTGICQNIVILYAISQRIVKYL